METLKKYFRIKNNKIIEFKKDSNYSFSYEVCDSEDKFLFLNSFELNTFSSSKIKFIIYFGNENKFKEKQNIICGFSVKMLFDNDLSIEDLITNLTGQYQDFLNTHTGENVFDPSIKLSNISPYFKLNHGLDNEMIVTYNVQHISDIDYSKDIIAEKSKFNIGEQYNVSFYLIGLNKYNGKSFRFVFKELDLNTNQYFYELKTDEIKDEFIEFLRKNCFEEPLKEFMEFIQNNSLNGHEDLNLTIDSNLIRQNMILFREQNNL